MLIESTDKSMRQPNLQVKCVESRKHALTFEKSSSFCLRKGLISFLLV